MGLATLNVRMPEELKAGGDAVLARKGKTVTEAVRGLYEYIEQHQELPDFMKDAECDRKQALVQRRRMALKRIAGILPADIDLDEDKQARLDRQVEPGVRK